MRCMMASLGRSPLRGGLVASHSRTATSIDTVALTIDVADAK
jgi:hypothetical protein